MCAPLLPTSRAPLLLLRMSRFRIQRTLLQFVSGPTTSGTRLPRHHTLHAPASPPRCTRLPRHHTLHAPASPPHVARACLKLSTRVPTSSPGMMEEARFCSSPTSALPPLTHQHTQARQPAKTLTHTHTHTHTHLGALRHGRRQER
jgi:hypothetical protein